MIACMFLPYLISAVASESQSRVRINNEIGQVEVWVGRKTIKITLLGLSKVKVWIGQECRGPLALEKYHKKGFRVILLWILQLWCLEGHHNSLWCGSYLYLECLDLLLRSSHIGHHLLSDQIAPCRHTHLLSCLHLQHHEELCIWGLELLNIII